MKATLGAAIAIIAVVASTVVVPAAGAASSSGCTTTAGVTVIVDFTHFAGGKVERGCAPGHPANGLVALHAAGFTSAGTAQYGDAFVCRIDGLPEPLQDACAITPSPSAYWAYWYARPSDSTWSYSALGVLDVHPKAGTIEAFAFGSHAPPSVAPSAAIPTTTTTRTTTTLAPPKTTPPPVTLATLPAAPRPTSPPVVALEPTTTTTTRQRKPAATTTTIVSARTTASARPTVGIVERSASGPVRRDSSGSPIAAILAVAIVGGLAIGAFAFTRSRRHRNA